MNYVRVIVDAPIERTTLGRIHTHTAPNPTPEPDAEQIRDLLAGTPHGAWFASIPHALLRIGDVLDAREALLAERTIPPVEIPAVYLPDDGHWPTGGTVTILLHEPPEEPKEQT